MLCAKKNNGTACFGDSGGKNQEAKSSLKLVCTRVSIVPGLFQFVSPGTFELGDHGTTGPSSPGTKSLFPFGTFMH